MVYFTCQHCGESVNKPRVEKHYDTKCKFKVPYLTCVDCLKDFNGQEYNVHTQCISEAERYSAKGTVFKQPSGMKKQTQYIEVIQTLLNSKKMTHVQRQLLEICAAHDNVPRKLKKFQNFMCNVGRSIPHSKQDEVDVFQLIETAWKNETNEKMKISQANQNDDESKVDGNNGICDTNTSTEMKNVSNDQDSSLDSNKSKNKNQENELLITDDRRMNIECNATSEESKENINTLTRKQLKKQKKYEKYLAELKNQDKTEENQDEETSYSENSKKTKKNSKMLLNNLEAESMEVEQETKQKKSKKRKMNDIDTEQTNGTSSEISKGDSPENNNVEENKNHKKKAKKLKKQEINHVHNGGVESADAVEITKPGTIPKKNKKRKMEEALSDNMEKEKKAKVDDEDDNGTQSTFDWTSVILRVLEGRPDKELSIKRLGKKVIDEYQTIRPDHRSYEDLLAKFNKKVNKTKGVRVLKDKAKLIT